MKFTPSDVLGRIMNFDMQVKLYRINIKDIALKVNKVSKHSLGSKSNFSKGVCKFPLKSVKILDLCKFPLKLVKIF